MSSLFFGSPGKNGHLDIFRTKKKGFSARVTRERPSGKGKTRGKLSSTFQSSEKNWVFFWRGVTKKNTDFCVDAKFQLCITFLGPQKTWIFFRWVLVKKFTGFLSCPIGDHRRKLGGQRWAGQQ